MFKSQGLTPIINTPIQNEVSQQKGFHLSYNGYEMAYGGPTTAIVIGDHQLFFVMRGNHKDGLQAAADASGLEGVLEYFVENIEAAHHMSDHLQIHRDHEVAPYKTWAEELLGEENISKIQAAVAALPATVEDEEPEI